MKKIVFVITILFFGFAANAQVEPVDAPIEIGEAGDPDDEVLSYSEIMPKFPGGDSALRKYLIDNITYPLLALENNVEGTVRVSFVIDKDGSITNVTIVGKKLGFGLDEEAIRLVKRMPKFKPGIQNGEIVRVRMMVPVKFRLE